MTRHTLLPRLGETVFSAVQEPHKRPPRLSVTWTGSAIVDSVGEPVCLVGWSGSGAWVLGATARSDSVAAVAAYEPFVVSVMREDDPSGSSKPEETQMDRTVAVTGGKLCRAVVAALIEEGWTVVNSDRVPSPDSQPTSYERTSPTTARARGDQDRC